MVGAADQSFSPAADNIHLLSGSSAADTNVICWPKTFPWPMEDWQTEVSDIQVGNLQSVSSSCEVERIGMGVGGDNPGVFPTALGSSGVAVAVGAGGAVSGHVLASVSATNTTHWLSRIFASPGSSLVCVEAAPSAELVVFLGESLGSRQPAEDDGVWLVHASACAAGIAQLNNHGSPSTLSAFTDADAETNCTFCVQRREILCNASASSPGAVGIAARPGHEASVHVWAVSVSTPMASKTSGEGVVVGVVSDSRWYLLHVVWALGVAVIIAFQFPMLFNVDI